MRYTVIFSDVHFGIRQNSLKWLESQTQFFDEMFSILEDLHKDGVRIICCGDVFDSRYSLSPVIIKCAQKIFKMLSSFGDLYIICGNHDFYYKDDDRIASPKLLLESYGNIIWNSILNKKDELFVPWYEWNNLKITSSVKRIYAHTDIVYSQTLKGYPPIVSGHIHTPFFTKNKYNIGSICQFNFGDSNSKRGFYIIDEYSTNPLHTMKFIENMVGIKFYTLDYDDFFEKDLSFIHKDDYIKVQTPFLFIENDKTENIIKTLKDITNNFYIQPIFTQDNLNINIPNNEISLKDFVINKCPDDIKNILINDILTI